MKQWFTLSEAAEKSGLGNTTIRSKIKSGEIEAVKRPSKHGHRWEISHNALETFLTQQSSFGATEAHEDLGGVRGLTIKSQAPKANDAASSSPLETSEPSVALPRYPSPSSPVSTSIESESVPSGLADTMNRLLEEMESLKADNTRLKTELQDTKARLNDEKHLASKVAFQLEVSLNRQEEALALVQEAQVVLQEPPKKVPLWKRWF